MAKIADVFGRVNAYILSVVLYVLGYVIQASAPNIYVSRCYLLEIHELTLTCPTGLCRRERDLHPRYHVSLPAS